MIADERERGALLIGGAPSAKHAGRQSGESASARLARLGALVAVLVGTLLAVAAALGWVLYLSSGTSRSGGTAIPGEVAPGAVDVGFSQAMSVHHQQAVYMAQIVLQRPGASPEIRALANTIVQAQLQEIGWMGGWLNLWNAPPIPPQGSPMYWMTTNATYYCGLHHKTMPGLASQTQINQLASASRRRLDVLFLQLMLRHHEGGIEMALYVARYGHLAAVRNLAARIVLDQSQEVTLMSGLLRLYHAAALPFPVSRALAHSDVGTVLNETPSLRTQNSIQTGWDGA
jgi:uncharacterized protein (DUF305 family)